MGQINFRVEDEELAKWRKAAEASGLSLSAWIRARCGPMSGNVVTVGEISDTPPEVEDQVKAAVSGRKPPQPAERRVAAPTGEKVYTVPERGAAHVPSVLPGMTPEQAKSQAARKAAIREALMPSESAGRVGGKSTVASVACSQGKHYPICTSPTCPCRCHRK